MTYKYKKGEKMKYSVWVGGVEINSYSKNSNFYNLTEFKKENK